MSPFYYALPTLSFRERPFHALTRVHKAKSKGRGLEHPRPETVLTCVSCQLCADVYEPPIARRSCEGDGWAVLDGLPN